MPDTIAALIDPVIAQGIDLRERLERGESPVFATEQAILEGLLNGVGGEEARRGDDRLATVRYALACWLDETFILDSPWESRWNERKLELALHGTNDRAWKFWELARKAETRSEVDVLEALFLCVMLGFRGQLRDRPAELQDWVAATRARITKLRGQGWPPPPELEVITSVAPLRGRESLQKVVMAGGLVLLLSVPLVAFFLVYQLGR
ncbi:DotU family type IV/VI secretion system protein [Tundrisphaera sp. TA3]|uniref:DotU family type IV/VI secretion system protein n=1 Tax=Tundrisphaera sp. TA3 TaxID=3435775 RepID=UPI003EB7A93E